MFNTCLLVGEKNARDAKLPLFGLILYSAKKDSQKWETPSFD